jgi:phage shock protein C
MTPSFAVDRQRGLWLGVCRGLADRAGAPVSLVRAGAVLLTLAGLGLPGVIAYVALGLLGPQR